jgi:metal-dependent amidase/aminoacylase/carboxypeptidase family protein
MSGTTFNVIPDTATIRGTVRAYQEDVRRHLQERLGELARGIASAMRATADVDYRVGYPILVNDAEQVELVRATLRGLLGDDSVFDREPQMGAEDFAFVLQRVPGAFMYLGVRDPSWATSRPVHTATFDLNENALPIGAAALSAMALQFLEQG